MEKAIGEQLLQIGLHCSLSQQLPVDALLLQLIHIVDFYAWRILHGQHSRGCAIPNDLWHFYPASAGKVYAELVSVLALQFVVDLL